MMAAFDTAGPTDRSDDPISSDVTRAFEHETETSQTVVALPGDGIGPEVMQAATRVLSEACPRIDWQVCGAGAEVFRAGIASGVPPDTLDAIAGAGVVLKGPLETPIGYGEKSANVTLRKLFELYANIRPVRFLPGIATPYSGRDIDFVVVRENVEDLYAGIEHMQTPSVAQCLKLISRKGSEKIARLAFALARAEGRASVHCATKANIMKLTEGLFKSTFETVAGDYPEIDAEHIVVDNCAHKMVVAPEAFEVIVTTNMNGDILSDLAAGLVGGLGLAPSANLGERVAMFEAVHGSAPDIAGQGVANPTALILSGVMLLRHIGAFEEADLVQHALYCTLKEGTHLTADIAVKEPPVSTEAFADHILRNFGNRSGQVPSRSFRALELPVGERHEAREVARDLGGVDIFIEWDGAANALGRSLELAIAGSRFRLSMISNRGTMVYPHGRDGADTVDHWRCRFAWSLKGRRCTDAAILDLLERVGGQHRWMHVEKLQHFDGNPGFTLAQGENR